MTNRLHKSGIDLDSFAKVVKIFESVKCTRQMYIILWGELLIVWELRRFCTDAVFGVKYKGRGYKKELPNQIWSGSS